FRNIDFFVKSLVARRKRSIVKEKILSRRGRRFSSKLDPYFFEFLRNRYYRYYLDYWRYAKERRRIFFSLEREEGYLPPFLKKRHNNNFNRRYSSNYYDYDQQKYWT